MSVNTLHILHSTQWSSHTRCQSENHRHNPPLQIDEIAKPVSESTLLYSYNKTHIPCEDLVRVSVSHHSKMRHWTRKSARFIRDTFISVKWIACLLYFVYDYCASHGTADRNWLLFIAWEKCAFCLYVASTWLSFSHTLAQFNPHERFPLNTIAYVFWRCAAMQVEFGVKFHSKRLEKVFSRESHIRFELFCVCVCMHNVESCVAATR